MDLAAKYSACNEYSRKQPTSAGNEELQQSLTRNYRVLPLYEKALSDQMFSKSHSLKSNEFLHCRWMEYQRINIAAKPEPFEFPSVSDYHFYNYQTCYKPDLSINLIPNHRYCLKTGLAVDEHGDVPIPSDVGFRRSGFMVEKKKRKVSKKVVKCKRK